MLIARRAFVLVSIVALLGSSTLLAQRGGNAGGRGGAAGRGGGMTDAQRKDIQASVSLADDAASSRPTPNDLSLTWAHDAVLKATDNQAYVPFTVTIDPSKVTGTTVSVYWRVMAKGAVPPPPPPPPANGKKPDKNAPPPPPPSYPYEALTTATVTPGAPNRIGRSFAVTAGSYDVYVVVREGAPMSVAPPPGKNDKNDKNDKNAKNAPPVPAPKAAVIKQSITIPDLFNGELSTSSVILAERIDPLTTPLSSQERINRPYALGAIEFVPFLRSKFAKKEELDTFIAVYNPKTDAANKPDVTIEFNFYTRQPGGDKFFNKTLPTALNAQTLPATFDMSVGQLQAGQAVPLASFPEGDYRLEIKVTDNVAKKDVTRDVNFTVSGS